MVNEDELEERLKGVSETIEGYEVKDLVFHNKGLRKYIGGLVKDPIYGRPIRDGWVGCSWYVNGEAMAQGYKKPRKDFDLKFNK